MAETVVQAEDLGKRYAVGSVRDRHDTLRDHVSAAVGRGVRAVARPGRRKREDDARVIWALRHATFDVASGDVLGVIGRNGAGKSTLLKILSRITDPTEGSAVLHGRVGSLLEVGTGFHPELTGRENVYLNGAILGMRRREIQAKFDEIVEFAGIERFVETPVKRYSSGMYVRLAFAVAAHLEPEILLVDEVLAVGDIAFQQKSLGRMTEIAQGGRTVLFVSHNLAAVSALCNRIVLVEGGQVTELGSPEATIARYLEVVHEERSTSLADRADRQGSGALRFTSVATRAGTATPLTGESMEIVIHYEAEEDLHNVMVGFTALGPLEEPIFLCSTEILGEEFERAPRRGSFVCTIPRLPLLPGRYNLNILAREHGAIADYVQSAASFDVAPGDFFGSGRLPPETHGRVVVDHSWAVAARDDE
jgi:lipopolysaccharide transport system ATP-binding protein